MARARASEVEYLEQVRREDGDGGDAIVAMCIDIEFGGEIVLTVGGNWHRREGQFDGEPEQSVTIRPHAGQMKAILWFASWLAVHAGRRDDPPDMVEIDDDISVDPAEVFSALYAGGRRGGKTWIAAVLCAMYAVHFPDAIVWCVSPSDSKHDEVRRYMSRILAPEWVSRETAADGWELINGSAIMLKSAYVGADQDAIKEGEAHLVWLNEGQKMTERVYIVARGAISDKSGLVLVCANPPVEAKDQIWVSDFQADAAAGRRASVSLHFSPLDNPHINRNALLSMKRELDERAFRIEVLGEFLPAVDAVAYNWIRSENERPMPLAGSSHWASTDPRWDSVDRVWWDVTADFLESQDEGEGLTDVPGLDVQVHPHIGGPVYRLYAPFGTDPTLDNIVAWMVDEVIVEGGDEEDYTRLLHDKGYDPSSTLIVCDATGEYQHSRRRNVDSPPPEWKGKGSFDIVRMGGYRHIVPPSKRFRRKNPDVLDRVRSFTSMIANSLYRRRLFCDPDRAPKTCKSIRGWKTVHGKPSRIQEEAHLGDAASYPIVRLFPRILRADKPGEVDKLTARVDRDPSVQSLLGSAPKPHTRDRKNRGL